MTARTPEPLRELADRVERAAGADRELDGSIWWATRTDDEIKFYDPTGFVRDCIQRDGSAGVALQQFFDSRNPACLARLAFTNAYTASLDAAMTLVPEGWGWLVSQPNAKAIASGLLKRDTPVMGEVQYGCDLRFAMAAATPALALTAASLRALAASLETNHAE